MAWSGLDTYGSSLLVLVEFCDCLATFTLEEQRALFQLWMHLAVDEDAGAEVPLCLFAQCFVFRHDAAVHLADGLEVGVFGVFVAVHFIAHCRCCWAMGDEALHEEKVWSVSLQGHG